MSSSLPFHGDLISGDLKLPNLHRKQRNGPHAPSFAGNPRLYLAVDLVTTRRIRVPANHLFYTADPVMSYHNNHAPADDHRRRAPHTVHSRTSISYPPIFHNPGGVIPQCFSITVSSLLTTVSMPTLNHHYVAMPDHPPRSLPIGRPTPCVDPPPTIHPAQAPHPHRLTSPPRTCAPAAFARMPAHHGRAPHRLPSLRIPPITYTPLAAIFRLHPCRPVAPPNSHHHIPGSHRHPYSLFVVILWLDICCLLCGWLGLVLLGVGECVLLGLLLVWRRSVCLNA